MPVGTGEPGELLSGWLNILLILRLTHDAVAAQHNKPPQTVVQTSAQPDPVHVAVETINNVRTYMYVSGACCKRLIPIHRHAVRNANETEIMLKGINLWPKIDPQRWRH